ncbi:MAG: fumarylacetoacetate hydrolase family protein [Candidatus Coatesbacteria bacterium]|nr:fumarylacetoacetate hydrolase family protein [Candidatus Coatesbacteria bacterium]
MEIKLKNKVYNPQRVFCIGRNYADHIKEMKSETPKSPVIFLKPNTCLVEKDIQIPFPSSGKDLHHEVEIVYLIGKEGKPVSLDDAKSFISGVSLGLDLTLRDVQNILKDKGQPWELSKAFDYSAPLGDFMPVENIVIHNIAFTCIVNNEIRQQGNSSDMIFSIENLIMAISSVWKLLEGDLIFTGTPSGVASLMKGDRITIQSPSIGSFSWEIL